MWVKVAPTRTAIGYRNSIWALCPLKRANQPSRLTNGQPSASTKARREPGAGDRLLKWLSVKNWTL